MTKSNHLPKVANIKYGNAEGIHPKSKSRCSDAFIFSDQIEGWIYSDSPQGRERRKGKYKRKRDKPK